MIQIGNYVTDREIMLWEAMRIMQVEGDVVAISPRKGVPSLAKIKNKQVMMANRWTKDEFKGSWQDVALWNDELDAKWYVVKKIKN